MKRFDLRTPILLAAVAAMSMVATVPASASGADGPRATAAKKCKPVTTRDGGRSTFVRTVGSGLNCRRARRVAARANGASYSALGFSCEPDGKPTRFGRLYGCGAIVDGSRRGIGFFYKKASDARASRKCANVRTFNGGTVSLLFTVKVRCRRARMVAKRANGRAYRVFGFRCTRTPLGGQAGRGFSCNRATPGTGQGIAFSYKKG